MFISFFPLLSNFCCLSSVSLKSVTGLLVNLVFPSICRLTCLFVVWLQRFINRACYPINWRTLMKCLRSTSWFISHGVNCHTPLALPLGGLLAWVLCFCWTLPAFSLACRGGIPGILLVYPSNKTVRDVLLGGLL